MKNDNSRLVSVTINYHYGYTCDDGCCYDTDTDIDTVFITRGLYKELRREIRKHGEAEGIDCSDELLSALFGENDWDLRAVYSVKFNHSI